MCNATKIAQFDYRIGKYWKVFNDKQMLDDEWLYPSAFFFLFFVFLQFCNVAEVAIIQKMIKANLATKKKWKWKEIKHPSMLFATLLEQNIKIWLLKKTFMKSGN